MLLRFVRGESIDRDVPNRFFPSFFLLKRTFLRIYDDEKRNGSLICIKESKKLRSDF